MDRNNFLVGRPYLATRPCSSDPCNRPLMRGYSKFQGSDEQMIGEGFMDVAKGIYDKIKSAGDYVKSGIEKSSGETGTMIKNIAQNITDSSPQFVGEKHALLKKPNGSFGFATFAGPGTHVVERLRKGGVYAKPLTPVDATAKAHDVRYALLAGSNNHEAMRRADQKMISDIERIEKNGTDSKFNTGVIKNIMKAKILGEKTGVLGKNAFLGGEPPNPSDRDLLIKQLSELEKLGNGINLPGGALKIAMLKHSKGLGKKSGAKAKAVIKGGMLNSPNTGKIGGMLNAPNSGKIGSGVNLPGRGTRTAGDSGSGVTLSGGKLNAKFVANVISRHLLPNIQAKMKQEKMIGKGYSRPQMHLIGKLIERQISNYDKQLKGVGIMDKLKGYLKIGAKALAPHLLKLATPHIKKFIGKSGIDAKYTDPLVDGLQPLLAKALNHVSTNPSGSGMKGLGIKNFFKDVFKGFKYGWDKTKHAIASIPGIKSVPILGDVVKVVEKIPDIPGSQWQTGVKDFFQQQ